VSALQAQAAITGLESELRRRLGNLTERALLTGDLGVVNIGPIHVDPRLGTSTLDAAQLRSLIAERLVLALTTAAPAGDAQEME
jgi:hypothetical protein